MAIIRGEGIEKIFYQNRQIYDKARADLAYLTQSGVLPDTEGKAALGRLNHSWNQFINQYENYIPYQRMLTAPLPPVISRHKRRGIIAFREWTMTTTQDDDITQLHPLFYGMRCEWKPIMYADESPTDHNSNGLYARMLTPEMATSSSYGMDSVWGLVELTGIVKEHTDGVLRGERAEVLTIYVTVSDDNLHVKLVMGALKSLVDSYFPVPVYPVTKYQSKLLLMREVLISCGVHTY